MWTYDRPTAPGYYWAIPSKDEKPEVVLVAFAPALLWSVSGSKGFCLRHGFEHWESMLKDTNGWRWWPEPVTPPEAPEAPA